MHEVKSMYTKLLFLMGSAGIMPESMISVSDPAQQFVLTAACSCTAI